MAIKFTELVKVSEATGGSKYIDYIFDTPLRIPTNQNFTINDIAYVDMSNIPMNFSGVYFIHGNVGIANGASVFNHYGINLNTGKCVAEGYIKINETIYGYFEFYYTISDEMIADGITGPFVMATCNADPTTLYLYGIRFVY